MCVCGGGTFISGSTSLSALRSAMRVANLVSLAEDDHFTDGTNRLLPNAASASP